MEQQREKALLDKALGRKAALQIFIEEGQRQFRMKYGIEVDPDAQQPPSFSAFSDECANELYQKHMKRYAAFSAEWDEFKKDMTALKQRVQEIMPEKIAQKIAGKLGLDSQSLTCDKLIMSLLLAPTMKKRWWMWRNPEEAAARKVIDEVRKHDDEAKNKYPTLKSLRLDLDDIPIQKLGGEEQKKRLLDDLEKESMQECLTENAVVRKKFAEWKSKISERRELERRAWVEYVACGKTEKQVREAASTDLSPYKAAIWNSYGAR